MSQASFSFDDNLHYYRIGRIQRQFEEFHHKNPKVYEELVKLARQAKRAGRTKIGIKMLFEVVRWQRFLATDDAHSDFKLSNNYHSRYARLIMEREPDLEGLFDLRELRSGE